MYNGVKLQPHHFLEHWTEDSGCARSEFAIRILCQEGAYSNCQFGLVNASSKPDEPHAHVICNTMPNHPNVMNMGFADLSTCQNVSARKVCQIKRHDSRHNSTTFASSECREQPCTCVWRKVFISTFSPRCIPSTTHNMLNRMIRALGNCALASRPMHTTMALCVTALSSRLVIAIPWISIMI